MDIMSIPSSDSCWDLIIFNHVPGEVPDDHLAMRELFRVLRPGGRLLTQTPVDHARSETQEPRLRRAPTGPRRSARTSGCTGATSRAALSRPAFGSRSCATRIACLPRPSGGTRCRRPAARPRAPTSTSARSRRVTEDRREVAKTLTSPPRVGRARSSAPVPRSPRTKPGATRSPAPGGWDEGRGTLARWTTSSRTRSTSTARPTTSASTRASRCARLIGSGQPRGPSPPEHGTSRASHGARPVARQARIARDGQPEGGLSRPGSRRVGA